MRSHEVNGVRELSEGPADAISTITRHIHGLALYMAAATEPDGDERERRLDLLNLKVTSAAFSALAYLAAEANFLAYEAELSRPTPPSLTVLEGVSVIADYLGLSSGKVDQLDNHGQIPTFRLPHSPTVYATKASLDEWRNSEAVKPLLA